MSADAHLQDNVTITEPADQNTKDGKVYQTTVPLTAGAHQYYFSGSDGTSPAAATSQISLQLSPANLNLTESVPFVNAGNSGGCSLTESTTSLSIHPKRLSEVEQETLLCNILEKIRL